MQRKNSEINPVQESDTCTMGRRNNGAVQTIAGAILIYTKITCRSSARVSQIIPVWPHSMKSQTYFVTRT